MQSLKRIKRSIDEFIEKQKPFPEEWSVLSADDDLRATTMLRRPHNNRPHKSKLDICLPLTDYVATVGEARQSCIAELRSGLHKVLAELHGDDDCSFECSSVLLGALSKAMHACLSPETAPSFNGLSPTALMNAAAEIREPQWFAQSTTQFGFRTVPSPEKHKCTLRSRVKPIIDRVSNSCQGLKCDDCFQLG